MASPITLDYHNICVSCKTYLNIFVSQVWMACEKLGMLVMVRIGVVFVVERCTKKLVRVHL